MPHLHKRGARLQGLFLGRRSCLIFFFRDMTDLVKTWSCQKKIVALHQDPICDLAAASQKRLGRIPARWDSSLLELWLPLLLHGACSLSIPSVLLNSSFVGAFQMYVLKEELSLLPHLCEICFYTQSKNMGWKLEDPLPSPIKLFSITYCKTSIYSLVTW